MERYDQTGGYTPRFADMTAAFWIAWRELKGRRIRLFLNISLVSMAVALCIAMELIAMARENAVAAKIDNIGPAFKLFPKDVKPIDLARYDTGNSTVPEQTVADLRSALSRRVRAVEERLIFKRSVQGFSVPVIGIDPGGVISPFEALKTLDDGEAAIGLELASMLGKGKDSVLVLGNHSLKISSVLPASGNSEDLAIFVSLPQAQRISGLKSAVNEIRIFPYPGLPSEEMEAFLRTEARDLNLIRISRGEVAEEKVNDSLHLYRTVLYTIAVLVVGAGLMIGTCLNMKERKLELATLVAIGSTGSRVLSVLILRSIIVGLFGAAFGYAIGALFALAQDFSSAIGVVWSLKLILITLGGTTSISLLATLPAAASAVSGNHVSILQEV